MNKSATPERPVEPKSADRLVLTAREITALAAAYALLDKVHQRHADKLDRAVESEVGDDS